MRELTEIEKAYWAGYIDGEGCFMLSKRKGNAMCGIFQLTTTDQAAVYAFEDMFGGSVHEIERAGNRRMAWVYVATGENLRILVETFLPYLRLKQQVASLVFGLPKLKGTKEHPPSILKEREEIYFKVRQLNKRGRFAAGLEAVLEDPHNNYKLEATL